MWKKTYLFILLGALGGIGSLLGCLGDLLLNLIGNSLGLVLNLLGDLACGSGGLTEDILGTLLGLGLGNGLGCDVGVNTVGTVLLDEIGEVLNGAASLVVNGGVLLAGGEELDGGEALDLEGNVVGLDGLSVSQLYNQGE